MLSMSVQQGGVTPLDADATIATSALRSSISGYKPEQLGGELFRTCTPTMPRRRYRIRQTDQHPRRAAHALLVRHADGSWVKVKRSAATFFTTRRARLDPQRAHVVQMHTPHGGPNPTSKLTGPGSLQSNVDSSNQPPRNMELIAKLSLSCVRLSRIVALMTCCSTGRSAG